MKKSCGNGQSPTGEKYKRGSEKSEGQRIAEDEDELRQLLKLNYYKEFYREFVTAGGKKGTPGARFWDHYFEQSDTWIIECTQRNKGGHRKWPLLMVLHISQFVTFRRGKLEADKKPNREILFCELPTVDEKMRERLEEDVKRQLVRKRDVS